MERFNTIAATIFKLTPQEIHDKLTSKDIPDWDSMNYLMFISELEKEFGVSFTMDEVLNFDSLGAVKAGLRSKGVAI